MKELNIIIPMAGMGTRLRPQTLLTPKPLFPIAGKSIVEHLVTFIAKNLTQYKIDNIVYIIGNFGKKVEEKLINIAKNLNATGNIVYQKEALGTAHAIYCAEKFLNKNVLIAFADTLFTADLSQINNDNIDGIIWTKEVEDPRQFGVVNVNEQGFIYQMEEKPENPKSNLAIIGIYFIKDATSLKNEIKFLLDNNIKSKGEYQLTDALHNMIKKGKKIIPGKVYEWMDCGNKKAVLETHKKWLTLFPENAKISSSANVENSTIIPPVYLGDNVNIRNSVIGPFVSVENNTTIYNSIISESIIKDNANIKNLVASNSIIGSKAEVQLVPKTLDISDFSRIFE